jgi:hypothetical protein
MNKACLSLFICLFMSALPCLSVRAQSPLTSDGASAPLKDKHLKVKITVQEPITTLEEALAALTQKTHAQTHLTLHSDGLLGHAPVLCLCHDAALPDVLESFSWLFGRAWRQTGAAELVMNTAPRDESPNPLLVAVHECGLQFLYAIDHQPPDLRVALTQQMVRIGSLPLEVQKAIEALVSTQRANGGHNPALARFPADLSQVGVHLEHAAEPEHAADYKVSFTALDPQPDGRTVVTGMTIFLTISDDERLSVSTTDEPSLPTKHLDQSVTLHLKNATLEEALRALEAQAPFNLIGIGAGPFVPHADVTLTSVPLHETLDNLAQTYGYRWEQGNNGIIRLWVARESYRETVTRLGKLLMQSYDRLPARVQNDLTTEGVPLATLPLPMQQMLGLLAETPKPPLLLTSEELIAGSKAPALLEAVVRIHIAVTPDVPLIHVFIGDKKGNGGASLS